MRRVIALVFVATGCVTPYQPTGWAGGYSETEEAEGVYLIRVDGNGFTDADTLLEYAQRRGTELCRHDGFPLMVLLNTRDHARTERTASTYTATTRQTYLGSETTITENPGIAFTKHVLTARAVCMTEKEYAQRQAARRQREEAMRRRLLEGATP
jgi:hypothetical protein